MFKVIFYTLYLTGIAFNIWVLTHYSRLIRNRFRKIGTDKKKFLLLLGYIIGYVILSWLSTGLLYMIYGKEIEIPMLMNGIVQFIITVIGMAAGIMILLIALFYLLLKGK